MSYNQVAVGPIPNSSLTDSPSNPVTALAGKAGETIVSELRGKYATQTYRGNSFILATAAAGTTIPIQAGSLASTFTLLNPVGSGKNVELISYNVGQIAATYVVGDISLYFQTITGAITAPTVVTALTIRSALVGGSGVSVCAGYSAATLVGAITRLMGLSSVATTTAGVNPGNYSFDGSVMLSPGTLITVAGTVAQTAAMVQTLIWLESPV